MSNLIIWYTVGALVLAGAVALMVRREDRHKAAIYLVVSIIAVVATFFISRSQAVDDIEIWNGHVTGKQRVHGTYEESYECFCSTDSKGNRSCQTCWRTHYTVKWNCDTTVGSISVDSEDSLSRRVYNLPDPAAYTQIVIGEPASKQNTYTNYIQAVPFSLFQPVSPTVHADFLKKGLLPAYPQRIYSLYKIDRFLHPNIQVPDAAQWNREIGELLKTRGATKQVNVVVVLVPTSDPTYAHALQSHWEGANKNDVVLIIGTTGYPKIDWVDVISWTKNELFKVQLRDEVLAQGTIDRTQVLNTVSKHIDASFIRRRMREFEYLETEIHPPTTVLVTLAFMQVLTAIGLTLISRVNRQVPLRGRRGRY